MEAADWAEGMGASLRAGLAALPDVDAVLVHLVDLPGVTAAAVARLAAGAGPATLRRAAYGGRPAHPVVMGREHWAAVAAVATGDAGARDYLKGHPALELVECADVAAPRRRRHARRPGPLDQLTSGSPPKPYQAASRGRSLGRKPRAPESNRDACGAETPNSRERSSRDRPARSRASLSSAAS